MEDIGRAELHCHTNESRDRGFESATEIVNRAYELGLSAVAITDCGSVRAFEEACKARCQLIDNDIKRDKHITSKALSKKIFKVIYGVELFLMDDLKPTVSGEVKNKSIQQNYVILNIETTGLSPVHDKIIKIDGVRIENKEIVRRFSTLINPEIIIEKWIELKTNITNKMVANAPTIDSVLPELFYFCENAIVASYYMDFDCEFLKDNAERLGIYIDFDYLDIGRLSRLLLPRQEEFHLISVAKSLDVYIEEEEETIEIITNIFLKLLSMIEAIKIENLNQVNEYCIGNALYLRKMPCFQMTILAKNKKGIDNLYKLVKISNLVYKDKQPRIPKSYLLKYREGLIIGSSFEAGELYHALLYKKRRQEVDKIQSFYEFFEIRSLEDNNFLVGNEEQPFSTITYNKDIKRIDYQLLELCKENKKLVIASDNVLFLYPEDYVEYETMKEDIIGFGSFREYYRYLRSTDEMLNAFQFLGKDQAEKVVITNTNILADNIDLLIP